MLLPVLILLVVVLAIEVSMILSVVKISVKILMLLSAEGLLSIKPVVIIGVEVELIVVTTVKRKDVIIIVIKMVLKILEGVADDMTVSEVAVSSVSVGTEIVDGL
jgi:hypothetical protein